MYKMTPEHKRKIGEANKRGKFQKCVVCKTDFWLTPWEVKRAKYPRKCCSRKCFAIRYKELFARQGSTNRFWKNGSWTYIRKQVLKRDKYICQNCGFSDKRIMHVDHIKERRSGGKNILENAQTLCPNCHTLKTLSYYGQPFAGK